MFRISRIFPWSGSSILHIRIGFLVCVLCSAFVWDSEFSALYPDPRLLYYLLPIFGWIVFETFRWLLRSNSATIYKSEIIIAAWFAGNLLLAFLKFGVSINGYLLQAGSSCLFFVLANRLSVREKWMTLQGVFLLIGIAEVFLVWKGIISRWQGLEESSYSRGSFAYPAHLYCFLCCNCFFCINLARKAGNWGRIMFMTLAVSSVLPVFIEFSRAGIFALALGLALTAKKKVSKSWLILLLFGGGCLIAGLLYLKWGSFLGRILIWTVTFGMIKTHFLFGIGADRFGDEYMHYQYLYFAHHYFDPLALYSDNVHSSFNEWLEGWAEQGLFLSLLIIGFIARQINGMIKEYSPARTELLSILTVFLLFSLVSHPFESRLLKLSFLAVLSFGSYGQVSFRTPKAVKAFLVSLILPVILSTIWLYRIEVRHLRHWRDGIQAAYLDPAKAESDYHAAEDYPGEDYEFLRSFALFYQLHGEYEKAVGKYMAAKNGFSDVHQTYDLAVVYEELRQYGRAEEQFLEATTMVPLKFKYKAALLDCYIKEGKLAAAREWAQIIIESPVKVKSFEIDNIKARARLYLASVR